MSDSLVIDELQDSPVLHDVLGDALPKLKMFHVKLQREGEPRGIIGPRDINILWERHILNSAAIVPFIRKATSHSMKKTVADIGSGGGFPGLVAAACLPDHEFILIEPMERRIEWLCECAELMSLDNVRIVRARAEEVIAAIRPKKTRGRKSNISKNMRSSKKMVDIKHDSSMSSSFLSDDSSSQIHSNNRDIAPLVSSACGTAYIEQVDQLHPFAVVTCRAVAPMTKLSGWTLPLLKHQGSLIALKGRSAQTEIDKAAKEISKYGGMNSRVVEAPVGEGLEPTYAVIVDKR